MTAVTAILIGAGCAFLGCLIIAVLAIGAVIGGPRKRRAGGWPAPGDGQTPVPGDVSPGEAAHPPSRPSPAPGLPGHDHGGLDYTVRVWKCGCIHLYGDRGQLTGCTPCQPATLDDDDIREWLS